MTDIETWLVNTVSEAKDLRYGAASDPDGALVIPPYTSSTADFGAFLLRIVQRSDRLGELLGQVRQVRGRLSRAQAQAKFDADVALDEARRRAAGRRVEFSTGKEREADASLDSFAEKRAAHLAQRNLDMADEAFELVNQFHWSLEGLRRDVRAIMSAHGFESHLER